MFIIHRNDKVLDSCGNARNGLQSTLHRVGADGWGHTHTHTHIFTDWTLTWWNPIWCRAAHVKKTPLVLQQLALRGHSYGIEVLQVFSYNHRTAAPPGVHPLFVFWWRRGGSSHVCVSCPGLWHQTEAHLTFLSWIDLDLKNQPLYIFYFLSTFTGLFFIYIYIYIKCFWNSIEICTNNGIIKYLLSGEYRNKTVKVTLTVKRD